METLRNISSRLNSAVMAGGAVFAASGVMQVVHPHEGPQDELSAAADYVTLGLFALGLLLVAPGFINLARYARSNKGAVAAAAGTVILALTCTTSLINGKDLSIFVVFAPLTNALWLFGSIALAVSLKRAGQVSKAVYVGLPLAWVFMIPLSQFGGPLLAGAYWMTVAYLLSTDSIQHRAAVPAAA